MHDGPTAFRFELVGNLNHEDARRLDQDWRTASSIMPPNRGDTWCGSYRGRVSRNSLLVSLQQTEEAGRRRFADVPGLPGVPAIAEQMCSVPASFSNKNSSFIRAH